MKAERMFFNVINGVLRGKDVDFSAFSDYGRLYKLFKEHNLIPFLYTAIKDKDVPEELKEKSKNEYNILVYTQENQDYYADMIFAELDKEGIDYAPLKGRNIRKLYPSPYLRVSCDVDFLYKKENAKRVKEILKELGGEFKQTYLNDDTYVFDGFINVEAHHSLMSTYDETNDYLLSVWDNLLKSDGKNSEYVFPNDYLYSYYISHARKHLFNGGFGTRTLIDIYFLQEKIDRKVTDRIFEDLKVSVFEKKISTLAIKMFSGDLPDFDKMSEEEINILDYILNGGAYGKTYNAFVVKNIGENGKKTKIRFYIRRLFVPYSVLSVQYPVLKHLPILLPFAWIYRVFVAILFKRGKIKAEIKTANRIDDNSVDRVNKVLGYFKEKNI